MVPAPAPCQAGRHPGGYAAGLETGGRMRSHTIMGGRATRLGAALAMALAVSTAGPAVASAAARSNMSATSCSIPGGDITWRNNHNGRYLEVYQSDTDPGNNVDAYTW